MKKQTLVLLTLISLSPALLSGCGSTTAALSTVAQSNAQNQTAMLAPSGMPPGGMPPGGMGPGAGGLPPNIEAIRTQYPELATALESMQSLTPEERRTQMDALFTAHPEWREALMPPGGARPSGAPAPAASAAPQD